MDKRKREMGFSKNASEAGEKGDQIVIDKNMVFFFVVRMRQNGRAKKKLKSKG